MKFGSLFTGVGGFDLGFEHAGFECVWQVERDSHCLEVLAEHYPNVERYTDVRTVGKHNLKPVDLVCGGFPCQDLSVAGKRAGFDGERSSLWFEFERIIDELQPKWVVIENVPGLLSSKQGRDFGFILHALDERGYGVAWRVLDSQNFGVAQRRRRVFIVGSFGNGRAAEVLFERESVSGDFESSRETGKEAASTLAGGSSKCHLDITSGQQDGNVVVTPLKDLSVLGADESRRQNGISTDGKSFTLRTAFEPAVAITMASGQANAEIMSERSPSLTGLHEQPIVFNAGDRRQGVDSISDTTSPTIQAKSGTGGNNMPIVLAADFAQITSKANYSQPTPFSPPFNSAGQVHVWEMHHASEVYREAWTGQNRIEFERKSIAPTLQARMGTGGNNVHLVGVRRLTPTECERLQGFPDGWTASQSDTQRYKQMGNAVTVNVAEWIAKRIAEVNK